MKIIVGAGLSGLICGALNAQSQIFERNKSDFVSHRAVLRFRDSKIGSALGITFKKVRVRKGIWVDGPRQPAPHLANAYSLKVRGIVGDASIWNLDASDRYIAPEDFHAILADICGKRVDWETDVTIGDYSEWRSRGATVISTIPLPVLMETLGMITPFEFQYEPIFVSRYIVPDCDVYQTIYFPHPSIDLYRATLTGSLLTLESILNNHSGESYLLETALQAFGIEEVSGTVISSEVRKHKQSYGKITPVDDGPRKALLHNLTQEWGIYSLGRFATWRNILLDDVFDDIAVIRRMMGQRGYDLSLERTKV